MPSPFRVPFGIFGLLVVLISLARAESSRAESGNGAGGGGHDGGGGSVFQSTSDEVKTAIDWAMAEVRENRAVPGDGPNWLFNSSALGPKIPGMKSGRPTQTVTYCLNQPVFCEPENEFLDPDRKYYTGAWEYLSLSPLELREEACPAPGKLHAAGSVSAHRVGATLCFSLSELRKVPPSALRREVAALLAHEMSHLLGYDEEIAVEVQAAISRSFEFVSRKDGTFLAYRLVGAMEKVNVLLVQAGESARRGGGGSVLFLLGECSGLLDLVGDMLPDGVNDRTISAARPELFESLRHALWALQTAAQGLGSEIAGSKLPEAEVDRRLETMRAQGRAAQSLLWQFFGDLRRVSRGVR